MSAVLAALLVVSGLASASNEPWIETTQVRAPRTLAGWVQGAYAPGTARYVFGDLAVSVPFPSEQQRRGMGVHLGIGGIHWDITDEGRSGTNLKNVHGELWGWLGNPENATTHGFAVGYGTRLSAPISGYLLSPVESAHRFYILYDGYIDWERFDLGYLMRWGVNDRTLMEMTLDVHGFYEATPHFALALGLTGGLSPSLHLMPGVRVRPELGGGPQGLEFALTAAIPSFTEEWRPRNTAVMLQVKLFARQPGL